MPPPEKYCQEYHETKLAEEKTAATTSSQTQGSQANGSSHPPYAAKRCDDCHDKSKETGLIKPKEQVCFVCHPNIIAKFYVHGPAAVGACLECHEPHSSRTFPSLLKVDKGKVCIVCHKERRSSAGLHDKVAAMGMYCTDCHDPHAGAVKYFIR